MDPTTAVGLSGGGNSFGSIVSPIASLGDGLLNFIGQQQTNSNNMAMQQDAEAFNAQQAQSAMNFSAAQVAQQEQYQTQMSDTAYQRGTADMKAAGINPMLAFAQGGASSPSGSSASGVAAQAPKPPEMTSPWQAAAGAMGRAVSSAMDAKRLQMSQDSTDSQVALNNALKSSAQADATLKANNGRVAAANAQMAEDRISANKASADYEAAKAASDSSFLKYDSWADRVHRDMGTVTNGVGAASKLFRGGYDMNDMLDAARGYGVAIPGH